MSFLACSGESFKSSCRPLSGTHAIITGHTGDGSLAGREDCSWRRAGRTVGGTVASAIGMVRFIEEPPRIADHERGEKVSRIELGVGRGSGQAFRAQLLTN